MDNPAIHIKVINGKTMINYSIWENCQNVDLLEVIERVASKIAPGPTPSANEAQVIKALETISGSESIGRKKLSKTLGLGEGATRTLLKHLEKEGLIEGSRRGIALSKNGERLFSDLRSKISRGIQIPEVSLTVGPFNVAVLVRNTANRVRQGLEQRDAAIKAGASGATTLIFSQNQLMMPSTEEDIFKNISSTHDMLLAELGPKENDVIIVGSGKSKIDAEIGAIMATLALLRSEDET